MIDQFERDVGFYNFRFLSTPEEAGIIPLSEILEKLIPYYTSGQAYWIHEKGAASVRLVNLDTTTYNDFVVFLISHSSTRVADPAFEHITTGAHRTEAKREGEGVAAAAHLVIKKTANNKLHKAILEKISGLGTSVISPFFNSILKNAYEDFSPVPTFTYNFSERTYRPLVDITGDLSEKLLDQIRKGKLTGIELIDHTSNHSDLDEDGVFVGKKTIIELSLAGDPDESVIAAAINKIAKKSKKLGYDEMKVRVQYEAVGNQTVPVRIDVDQEATETLAVRKEVVSVASAMSQRHDSINHELVTGMIGLLS